LGERGKGKLKFEILLNPLYKEILKKVNGRVP